MKHYIIAKFLPEVTKEQKAAMLPEIKALFGNLTELNGIHGVSVEPNCIDRPNRADIMIEIEMERDALPVYDGCIWHKQWKEQYGKLLESKTIFDRE